MKEESRSYTAIAKYTEQADVVIDGRSDFNKQEFEKWFFANLSIGSNNVLTYLMEKNRQKKIAEEAKKILKEQEK